jgi:uncharacterized membrane protein (UPF0127 family)
MHHLFLALAISLAAPHAGATEVDGGFVLTKGKRFFAEVARTPAEHARGLMYRTGLKQNYCMFFVYDQDSYHSVWMKNCYIALDVAWISAEGVVVEVAENLPPCSPVRGTDCPSYGGNVLSRHFVEFPAGTIKRLGLMVGEKIGWDLQFSNGRTSKGGIPIPSGPPATERNPPPAKKAPQPAGKK